MRKWNRTRPLGRPPISIVVVGLLGLLLALGLAACRPAAPTAVPPTAPPAPTATVVAPTSSPVPTATPVPLKTLKVSPETGFVGTPFTIAGEGFQPGQQVQFVWLTSEGSYVTKPLPTDVQFRERSFAPKRVPVTSAIADGQGRVTANSVAPEGVGEVHDIYGVVAGQDVAKGGFRIFRNTTMSPTSGPVGTLITFTVKGLGSRPFENTMAVRYDNAYTGFLSAVTTKGTATFRIRAAGPVGQHVIQLTTASPGLPFLNSQQGGTKHIPYQDVKFNFTVTAGSPIPPSTIEWPDASRLATVGEFIPKTATAPGISAKLEPASGPVLTQTTLRASGLSPNTEVQLLWITGRGSDSQGIRYVAEVPIRKATSAADGSLTVPFQVTDDRGGWQAMKVAQGEKVLAEVPFHTERSLVGTGISPQRVKAGEAFTVNLKGGGWTELDKGFAITYDNAYIGYACSVTSSGDLTVNLVATGEPGVHLIDIYPMIYRHKGDHPAEFWNFQLPQLTALDDHPALALGYKLPIIRLAIEVVE